MHCIRQHRTEDSSLAINEQLQTNANMNQQKQQCHPHHVKINGRTLKRALEIIKANHRFGDFSATDWVNACPVCDAYALGAELKPPSPFLCADGVMRTIDDFDGATETFSAEIMDFCGFTFSRSALDSGIALCVMENPSTLAVQEMGATLGRSRDSARALEFSEKVCIWGGGQRVWANLIRRNPDALGERLGEWFRFVDEAPTAEAAIERGIEIDGLAVSFASKHLRMISPEKYAVLDDVLCSGLGFALNPKGYRFFLQSLRDFLAEHHLTHNVAILESGLFMLVRQNVRSKKA